MLKIHVRWMIRRDLPECMNLERQSFEFPWREDDFIRCLRQRNVIEMVAELPDETIAGYMIYELHRTRLHLLNFCVGFAWRRQGAGRAMMEKLQLKLSQLRRTRIVLEVRETNMQGQLFFKALGFRAVSVLRDYYEDTDEDAYVMQYRFNEVDHKRLTDQQRGRQGKLTLP